ncbi:MAG: oligosaccharide flippase family protein [Pseudomonadota bacterium]
MSSLRDRVVSSILISSAADWVVKLLGVVSMVVLARLLTPGDYGLAIAATTVVGFIKALTSVGQDQYLIQKTDLEPTDLSTAWSARLLLALLASLLLFFGRQAIADYFSAPGLVEVLGVLAWVPVIDALRSIGLVVARRELDFKPNAKTDIAAKMVAVVVTLATALAWRNYWALVAGEMASALTFVALSHVTAPYRVRPTLRHYSAQWRFVRWLYVQGLANLVREKIDSLLVARYLGVVGAGHYLMSLRLADLAINNLLQPASAGLYSGFAKLKEDPPALASAFLRALSVYLLLVAPIWVAMTLLATPLIRIVLGEQWLAIAPVMPIVVTMYTFMLLAGLGGNVLLVLGRVRYTVLANSLSVAVFICVMLYFAESLSLGQFAAVRALTVLLALSMLFYPLSNALGVGVLALFRHVWRSLAAGGVAYGVLLALGEWPWYAGLDALPKLLFGGLALCASYALPHWLLRRDAQGWSCEYAFVRDVAWPLLRKLSRRLRPA